MTLQAHEHDALGRGLRHFRAGDYFTAHDDWEEVWQELRGRPRLFWQAMIQLVVGGYHYTNGNLRGCQGLWHKALHKCEELMPQYETSVPEPITHLHAVLTQGLHLVAAAENPLPLLATFATTTVDESWFTLT